MKLLLSSSKLPFFIPLFCFCLLYACRVPVSYQEKQVSDSKNHIENRDDWIAQNRQLRFSAGIKLSEKEKEVDAYLDQLRQDLIIQYRANNFYPTARNFYFVKSHMEQTELFKKLHQMPKGGLLHAHDLALGSAWYIIDDAIQRKNCYVFWAEKDEFYVKGQLQFFKAEDVPPGFQSVQALASSNTNFRQELYDLLTFGKWTADDSVSIWKAFEPMFQRRIGYINYEPVFEDFFYAAFDSLLQHNIQHIELRSIITANLYDLEHKPGYFTRDSMVDAFRRAQTRIQTHDPSFSLKLIYTGLRFLPRPIICADLVAAFRTKKANPDLVMGYDLVGEEDGGFPTLYHLDCWDNLDSLANEYGVDMPLYLHNGESNWHDNTNLYDALLLRTKRIGHGINLFRFPLLEQKVLEHDICIEISPLSNQILRYTPDLRVHPGIGYLSKGIPITINSDDPSVFGYEGLAYDYWAAYMAWGLDLRDLKQISKNGILYSSLTELEKKKALAFWEKEWNSFVEGE